MAGDDFFVALGGVHLDAHAAEAAVLSAVGGVVGEDVLVANVVGDLAAEGLHLVERDGEVGHTAGDVGQLAQDAPGAAAVALLLGAGQADQVEGGFGLLGVEQHSFVGGVAEVIDAVGDDQQDFLLARAAVDVLEGGAQRVVKSGAAAGLGFEERGLQDVHVVGEVPALQIQVVIGVEVDDKELVAGISQLHESQRSGPHFLSFFGHGSAVVEDQPDRDRHILAAEDGELLLDIVFEDGEVLGFQVGHQASPAVHDGGVQDDQVNIAHQGEFAVAALRLLGAGEQAHGQQAHGQCEGSLSRGEKHRTAIGWAHSNLIE